MLTNNNKLNEIAPESNSVCLGFFAFVVGTILASMWTVANQGWTIVSILLFGEFSSLTQDISLTSGSAQLRFILLQLSGQVY